MFWARINFSAAQVGLDAARPDGAEFPADSAEFPGFLCEIACGLDSAFEREY